MAFNSVADIIGLSSFV